MAHKKFELVKSPVDHMLRRWELRKASLLSNPFTGEPFLEDGERDHDVWIITGVFRRRKDVFAAMA